MLTLTMLLNVAIHALKHIMVYALKVSWPRDDQLCCAVLSKKCL